ncbi:hypothetical protein ADL21_04565 [Streptomyces albus subsp. albus]|nr:hypothetical protein ADL21_04565 [Streptomyces albus subsp. albus]
MIRIVTAASLAALHAEVDDAWDLARQAREEVAEQWAARLAVSRELIEERKALTGIARTAIVQAEELSQQAAQLRQAFTAALLVMVRQAARIRQLEQAGHNAMACAACEAPVAWQDCPTGGWWHHLDHPGDGHDAIPMPASAMEGGEEA